MNPLELSKAIGVVTQDDIDKTEAAQGSPRTTVLVRELAAHHRSRLLKHLLGLGEEDRLLRFGQVVGDHVIEAYVDSIDFDHDKVFGVYDDRLALVGVGHLAYLRDNPQGRVAEFGVSVLESARGKGVGSALFQRAAMHGRNTKVRTLYMHCLSRNAAMMHIAKKAGMRVQYAYGEADAYLELPPADTMSLLTEAIDGQVADLDYLLKRNLPSASASGARCCRSSAPSDPAAPCRRPTQDAQTARAFFFVYVVRRLPRAIARLSAAQEPPLPCDEAALALQGRPSPSPASRCRSRKKETTMNTQSVRLPLLAAAVLLGVGTLPATAQDTGMGDMAMINPAGMKWGDAPPTLPKGAKLAVLYGDPGKDGPFVVRIKTPAGYKIAPHWHTQSESLTVISGTLYLGGGDAMDMGAAHALKTGGFHYLPGGAHHYAFTKTATVVQIGVVA
ncbi:hypothetical protein LMG10661_03797 [Ralstonia syzygii subsp. syzygii]|nr:hypothetical protein LMG10661_03797 [Ralstonia syzygii subsp. syzygii]